MASLIRRKDPGQAWETEVDTGGGGSQPIDSPLALAGEVGADGGLLICDLWLDGSDAVTIHEDDNAGFVSKWDDKSGLGHDAVQATVEAQPRTGAATINGRNAPSFDGAAMFLDSTAIAYPLGVVAGNDAGNFASFVVYEAGSVDLDNFNYALVGDDSLGQFMQLNNSAAEPQLQGQGAVLEVDPTGAHIGAWISRAVNIAGFTETEFVRCDDTIATSGGSSPVASDTATVRVGATNEGGASRFWLGKIAEVIHFSGQMDSYQSERIMDYLRGRFGTP